MGDINPETQDCNLWHPVTVATPPHNQQATVWGAITAKIIVLFLLGTSVLLLGTSLLLLGTMFYY